LKPYQVYEKYEELCRAEATCIQGVKLAEREMRDILEVCPLAYINSQQTRHHEEVDIQLTVSSYDTTRTATVHPPLND
jgi:hypothetical protein